jgi:hypothetical protein
MKMTIDPIELLARVDPLSGREAPTFAAAAERRRTYDLIHARREATAGRPSRFSPRRVAVAGIVLAIALGVPALATSGRLGSLFGFTNEGTPVDDRDIGLHTASALGAAGARGTVTLLAARDGVGIYAARGANGERCFFVGPATGMPGENLSGGCMNAAASTSFPSPEHPVVNLSQMMYRPGDVGEIVRRLQGVAADGVARMQVLGLDCSVIAEAPVVGNVYVTDDIPERPAAAIVGLDGDGRRVYVSKLRSWDESACTRGER